VTVSIANADIVASDARPAGVASTWGPAGTRFNPKATLTLPFALPAGRELAALAVFVEEADGRRFSVRGEALSVDAGAGLVSLQIDGFTTFQPGLFECGAGTDGPPCEPASPVRIKGLSGALTSVEGTWVACHPWGREERVFAGRSITFAAYTGTSPAAGMHPCPGGTLDTTGAYGPSGSLTVSEGVDHVISGGWLDGQREVSAPPNSLSGASILPTNPTATLVRVSGTLTGPSGAPMMVSDRGLALFLDDSQEDPALYRGVSHPERCPELDGKELCLSRVDPLLRVPRSLPAGLRFEAASGSRQPVEGTWVRCARGAGDTDVKEVYRFTGRTLAISTYAYTSTDETCSAGEALNQSGELSAAAGDGAGFVATGWTDNMALAVAPTRAAGDGQLPATPAVTEYLFSGTYGRPIVDLPFGGFIDDSATPPRLYRLHEKPGAECRSGDRGLCLFVGFLTRQE
jgi:hypothetical protein